MKLTLVRNFSFVVKDSKGNKRPLMSITFDFLDAVLVQNTEDVLMLKSDYEFNMIKTFCDCIGYDTMESWRLDGYKRGLSLIGFFRSNPIELYLRINGKALNQIEGIEFTNE